MKICLPIDVRIPADRNIMQKGSWKEIKYKNLCMEIQRMWNVKCMIIPANNCSHRNCKRKFKGKFESHTRKTFNRFNTKDSYTWNITHNTAVLNLKPERWGSLLFNKRPVTK
jgi:hypothetical protein